MNARLRAWRPALFVLGIAVTGSLAGCSSLPFASTPAPSSDVEVVSDSGGEAKKIDVDFPPMDDATLVSCSSQGAGNWMVAGQVQNPTSQTLEYAVVVDLRTAAGTTVDQVMARPATAVKAKQNGNWSVTATAEPTTVTACRITSVIRTPA